MIKLLFILLLVNFTCFGQVRPIYPPAPTPYTHSYSLTIDHTQCGASNSTNFTVKKVLTSTYLKTVSNGGSVQHTTTYKGQTVPADVVFSTSSSFSSFINWDVVYYDPVAGTLEFSALISTLDVSTDVVFYIGIGNAALTTWQSPGLPYDTYTKAYYPSPDGTTLSMLDYSGNSNDLTVHSCTATAGQYDGGDNFALGNYNTTGSASALPALNAAQTYEVWVNVASFQSGGSSDQTNSDFITLLSSGPTHGTQLKYNGSHQFVVTQYGGTTTISSSTVPSLSTWYYVAYTTDGTNNKLYSNAASIGTSTTTLPAGTPGIIYLSTYDGSGEPLVGKEDEVMVSSIDRAPSWLTAKYNMVNSNFVTATLLY